MRRVVSERLGKRPEYLNAHGNRFIATQFVGKMRRDTHHQGLWRPQFLSPTWLNNFPSVVATPFTREIRTTTV
jgi:hypothetical protein